MPRRGPLHRGAKGGDAALHASLIAAAYAGVTSKEGVKLLRLLGVLLAVVADEATLSHKAARAAWLGA